MCVTARRFKIDPWETLERKNMFYVKINQPLEIMEVMRAAPVNNVAVMERH